MWSCHASGHHGEGEEVALALNEQYLPKFSGDVLPSTATGLAVAIADKLDTLVGIFGINQPPTGSKDPFGLRRAAIGLLRIIIEKELALDINVLSQQAVNAYGSKLSNTNTVNEVFEFLLGRYRAMYEEQGIAVDVIAGQGDGLPADTAVAALKRAIFIGIGKYPPLHHAHATIGNFGKVIPCCGGVRWQHNVADFAGQDGYARGGACCAAHHTTGGGDAIRRPCGLVRLADRIHARLQVGEAVITTGIGGGGCHHGAQT